MGADKKKKPEKKGKPPLHEERWFEGFVLLSCAGLAWLFWQGLDTASPLAQLNAQSAESLRILSATQQMAQGQYLTIFSEADLPPVYPALLTLVTRLRHLDPAGQTGLMALLPLAKLINFYTYLVSIGLVHWFARSRVERPISFIITVLYTISPLMISTAFLVGPHILYLVFALASLMAAEKVFSKPDSKPFWVLLGACLLGAMLTLQQGYLLLLAFFLAGIRKLDLRKSLVPAGIILLLSSPFLIRDAYYHYEPGIRAQGWNSVLPALERQTRTPKLETFSKESTQSLLGSISWQDRHFTLSDLPWLRWLIMGLIALGVAYGFTQLSGIGSLYLLCALGSASIFSTASPQTFAPLIPLLLLYLYLGVLRLGDWLSNLHVPLNKVSIPALSGLLVLTAASTYVSAANFLDLPSVESPTVYLATLAQSEVGLKPKPQVRAKRWLSLNAPSSALVGHADESLIHPPRPRSAAEGPGDADLLKTLLQLDYIVEEPSTPEVHRTFNQVLDQARQRFMLVYNDPESGTRIWQVLGR